MTFYNPNLRPTLKDLEPPKRDTVWTGGAVEELWYWRRRTTEAETQLAAMWLGFFLHPCAV